MARISHLYIKNFRSIAELDLDVPQVMALIGPNNSGKSNLLDAMYRALGRTWLRVNDFTEDDVFGRDPAKDICIELKFDPPPPFQKYKGGPTLNIKGFRYEFTRYKVGPFKGQRRLDKSCLDDAGKPPVVLAKAPKAGEQRKYEPIIGIPDEIRERVPLIYLGSPRRLEDQLPSARYSLLRQLFDDIDQDFNDPTRTVAVIKPDGTKETVPRRERFKSLMADVVDLLRTPKFTALEQSIKTNALTQLGFDPVVEADKLGLFFAPFDSVDFYRSLEMRVQETGFSVKATELGDGVQNAIVIAILRAFEERRKQGAIILIEEPEMFLHPQMQRSLYKTLRTIGQANQVIYSTHSPHFVSIPEYTDIGLVRRGPDGTYVVRSALPSTGKLKEKLIKELDPERSEMFFARAVVIVEGDTEKLSFPEYARRLGIDLDKVGITIVEVGGKRNLKEFALIAASFEIPVALAYDEDSSDFVDKAEETKFNSELDAFNEPSKSIRVWKFTRTFEDHLRTTISDATYQAMCNKFAAEAGRSKPVRARLIAMEEELAIPATVSEILRWVANS